MIVTDSCIFLMVLLPMVERWPDVLFSILLIPSGGKFVSLSVTVIWLVVFSTGIAVFKSARELSSSAQPLLIKHGCLWWVAMAGKIALFVPFGLLRPKCLPFHRHLWVVAVVWCSSCQEELQVEMRQRFLTSQLVWNCHINFILQFVVTHTHSWCIYSLYCYCHLKLFFVKDSTEICWNRNSI